MSKGEYIREEVWQLALEADRVMRMKLNSLSQPVSFTRTRPTKVF